uniref:Uncharacterized protein n=1 Tax=Tanacetum cinerariifolium TaxID=118510 RepID=A0A699II39_TANCI|nr:hypothetical protein [Tanacetum cinerariifolium]
MVDDEPVGRKSVQTSSKEKDIMYEFPCPLPTKESQVSVTNYKKAIVNGKAKMVEVEDVGLVHPVKSVTKVQRLTAKQYEGLAVDDVGGSSKHCDLKKCRNKVNVTRKKKCLNNSKTMGLRKGYGKRVTTGGHGRGLGRLIGLNVDAVDDDPQCIPGASDTYLSYNLSRVVAHTPRTADRHHYFPLVVTRSSSCFLD